MESTVIHFDSYLNWLKLDIVDLENNVISKANLSMGRSKPHKEKAS